MEGWLVLYTVGGVLAFLAVCVLVLVVVLVMLGLLPPFP